MPKPSNGLWRGLKKYPPAKPGHKPSIRQFFRFSRHDPFGSVLKGRLFRIQLRPGRGIRPGASLDTI